MEDERVRKTNKDGKKKEYNSVLLSSNISKGGGKRIPGLLVLGGAMAVAGYVAVLSLHSFVTKRNKAKEKSKSDVTEHEPKPQQLLLEDGCKSQGHGDHQIETTSNSDGDAVSACSMSIRDYFVTTLSFTAHSPKSLNKLYKCNLFQEEEETDSDLNNSSELVSPNNFQHQEIVLHDDSHPESVASSSSNENEFAEEDGLQQNLDSMQTETKDDDEDDNNDDIVIIESEKEENSSKETEGTSLNSNEDKAEQDLKGEERINESDIQTQEAAEMDISASDDTSLYAGTNMAMNVKANLSEGLNYQPSPSYTFQLRTWLMPMLLQALLLVLVLYTCTRLFISFTK
ncbi:PREDICTED: uncharacterized protein LOC109353854 [Lupinus angustifolius]|uniref:uncharacterized protein LOC109353854 n=1 Tax=Lupinus angustifolius TaxID=3871 RepID=UPI00092F46DE|nr:PREDICTED: uncharacterized protein LOC109353854 [Lupinus angustifolius]